MTNELEAAYLQKAFISLYYTLCERMPAAHQLLEFSSSEFSLQPRFSSVLLKRPPDTKMIKFMHRESVLRVRYFCLTDPFLFFYADSGLTRLKGVIPLIGSTVTLVRDKKYKAIYMRIATNLPRNVARNRLHRNTLPGVFFLTAPEPVLALWTDLILNPGTFPGPTVAQDARRVAYQAAKAFTDPGSDAPPLLRLWEVSSQLARAVQHNSTPARQDYVSNATLAKRLRICADGPVVAAFGPDLTTMPRGRVLMETSSWEHISVEESVTWAKNEVQAAHTAAVTETEANDDSDHFMGYDMRDTRTEKSVATPREVTPSTPTSPPVAVQVEYYDLDVRDSDLLVLSEDGGEYAPPTRLRARERALSTSFGLVGVPGPQDFAPTLRGVRSPRPDDLAAIEALRTLHGLEEASNDLVRYVIEALEMGDDLRQAIIDGTSTGVDGMEAGSTAAHLREIIDYLETTRPVGVGAGWDAVVRYCDQVLALWDSDREGPGRMVSSSVANHDLTLLNLRHTSPRVVPAYLDMTPAPESLRASGHRCSGPLDRGRARESAAQAIVYRPLGDANPYSEYRPHGATATESLGPYSLGSCSLAQLRSTGRLAIN